MRNSSRGERMSRTTRLTMITAGLIWIGGIGHGSAWAGSLCTLPSQEEADIQAAAVSIQDEPTQQQEIDENGHYKPRRKARSPSTGTAQEPVKAQSAEGQTPPPDTDETDTAVGEAGEEVIKRLDLEIEFVRPAEGNRIQVRVNGQQVDPRTAFMILRLVEGHFGEPIGDRHGEGFMRPSGNRPAGQQGGRPHDMENGRPEGGMRGNGGGGPPGGRGRGNPPGGNGQPNQSDQGAGQPNDRLPFGQVPGAGQRDEPLFVTEPKTLTADLISTVMTVARDYESPDVYRRLEDMQVEATDEVFNRELRKTMMKWQPEIDLYQEDPTGYDLRLKDRNYSNRTYELVMQYRQATVREDTLSKDIIANELRNVVEAHFDVRQEQREHEYQQLSEDLSMLRRRIDQRLERRSIIIEAHLRRMMTDPVDF